MSLLFGGKTVVENAIYTPGGSTADNSACDCSTDKSSASNYDRRNLYVGGIGK